MCIALPRRFLSEKFLLLGSEAMAFAQLTYRASLRDIETCLRSMHGKLYSHGIPRQGSALDTGDANESRDGGSTRTSRRS